MNQLRNLNSIVSLVLLFSVPQVFAQDPNAATGAGKKVDVEKLKKQYWSQDTSLDVVQNRVYSKSKRIQLGIYGGRMIADPFVSVISAGFSLGYHFDEYWSVHAVAWKDFPSWSGAYNELKSQVPGATTNSLFRYYYTGAEVGWNLIYGKLNFAGSNILYLDTQLLFGVGVTGTESGPSFTENLGIGQRFWLSNNVALKFEYRIMHYREQRLDKKGGTGLPLGSPISNFTNAITVGVDLFPF
jgi:outer membrane beta-barrel protein